MHDVHEWPDNHRRPDEVLATPMIITDTQPHIQSQVDGQWYDSKRALRSTYKASGNREGVQYTEVGNDPAHLRPRQKPKADRMKVRAAVHGAFSKAGLGA